MVRSPTEDDAVQTLQAGERVILKLKTEWREMPPLSLNSTLAIRESLRIASGGRDVVKYWHFMIHDGFETSLEFQPDELGPAEASLLL